MQMNAGAGAENHIPTRKSFTSPTHEPGGSRQAILLALISEMADTPAEPKKPERIITCRQLWEAIHEILETACQLNSFTSLTYPAWDGWVTVEMIRWRLPDRISGAVLDSRQSLLANRDAYHGVEDVLEQAARAGLLERRIRKGVSPTTEYRRPGEIGCCYWEPSQPMGPEPGDTEYDERMETALRSRQVKATIDSLSRACCDVPPYVVARVERYAGHPSRQRRGHTVRVCW